MTAFVLMAKVLLDAVATVAFLLCRNGPMALMFLGFAIADLGAAWIALR